MSVAASDLAGRLNLHCQCLPTDVPRVRQWLEQDLQAHGSIEPSLLDSHPHLLAAQPIFVDPPELAAAHRVIRTVHELSTRPGYRDAASRNSPHSALLRPGADPLLAFDFHLTPRGPQLIEINTNPGGALINTLLLRVQRTCCPEVRPLVPTLDDIAALEHRIAAMFEREWRAARGDAPLARIAIVDAAPTAQYLYPEFLLFKKLFASRGIQAVITDPSELHFDGTHVRDGDGRIDLIYNRLTDFSLEKDAHRELLAAYRTGAIVITPSPHAHALFANKHNLITFSDGDRLHDFGASPQAIEFLLQHVPRTLHVSTRTREDWWADRRAWFFKPASGFGSRGAYRGDKLTRKAFDSIICSDYVAQSIAAPADRHIDGSSRPLKWDLRIYTDGATPLLHAARLYDGQTTNFRTSGGGFAMVLTASVASANSA